jgi:hypothetical protein
VDYNEDDDENEKNTNSSGRGGSEIQQNEEGISIAELIEMLQEGMADGDNENDENGRVVIQLGAPVFGQKAAYDGGDDDEEDDDDDGDNEQEEDPYTKAAASEFTNSDSVSTSSSIVAANGGGDFNTVIDWGGALSKLRERVDDVESGKSKDPAHVLFRQMSSPSPNQLIGQFVSSANPQVVQAMSGAVQSLLGGLSNPNMGIETIVKASGEKIGSLCFQLQMTGTFFLVVILGTPGARLGDFSLSRLAVSHYMTGDTH